MAYPRSRKSRAHKFTLITGGDYSIANTGAGVFVAVDTSKDIVLAGEVGDTIKAELMGMWNGNAPNGGLDIATVVSGSVVNRFSGTAEGIESAVGAASEYHRFGGAIMYDLLSGDISAGLVTFRLMAVVWGGGGAAKTLLADTSTPFFMSFENLGPQDPH